MTNCKELRFVLCDELNLCNFVPCLFLFHLVTSSLSKPDDFLPKKEKRLRCPLPSLLHGGWVLSTGLGAGREAAVSARRPGQGGVGAGWTLGGEAATLGRGPTGAFSSGALAVTDVASAARFLEFGGAVGRDACCPQWWDPGPGGRVLLPGTVCASGELCRGGGDNRQLTPLAKHFGFFSLEL